MKIIILFILLLIHPFIQAQTVNRNFDIFIGGQYGGPIPSESLDSSSGSALFSPQFGARYMIPIFKKSKLAIGLSISQKGASYQQTLKHDTLVDVGYGMVPTFYKAKVVGEMKLTYLDLPIDYCFQISSKQTIALGFLSSFLISGFDRGTVTVKVGYGGFSDFVQPFNNFSNINKFDFGAHFFYKIQLFNRFYTSLEAYRSLRSLYKSNGNNLYHTQASLLLGYSF